MQAPTKLTYEELRNGMVPFLHFPAVEQEMQEEKTERIKKAEQSAALPQQDEKGNTAHIVRILKVNTAREYQYRLKLILATTQGSLEALDRVCMVICPSETTWSERRKSETATQSIADFLMDPTKDEKVPWYTAERFRLPTNWLQMMRGQLSAEIHSSLQSLYNTKTGLALESRIAAVVKAAGYSWEKGFVDFVDEKEVDVAVPDIRLPRILIMSSYNLTTASSQSQRAREQKSMYEDIARYNSGRARVREPDVQLVNIIDGGGWLARPSDLVIMHQHCDYALAEGQLNLLPDILHYHMRQT